MHRGLQPSEFKAPADLSSCYLPGSSAKLGMQGQFWRPRLGLFSRTILSKIKIHAEKACDSAAALTSGSASAWGWGPWDNGWGNNGWGNGNGWAMAAAT